MAPKIQMNANNESDCNSGVLSLSPCIRVPVTISPIDMEATVTHRQHPEVQMPMVALGKIKTEGTDTHGQYPDMAMDKAWEEHHPKIQMPTVALGKTEGTGTHGQYPEMQMPTVALGKIKTEGSDTHGQNPEMAMDKALEEQTKAIVKSFKAEKELRKVMMERAQAKEKLPKLEKAKEKVTKSREEVTKAADRACIETLKWIRQSPRRLRMWQRDMRRFGFEHRGFQMPEYCPGPIHSRGGRNVTP